MEGDTYKNQKQRMMALYPDLIGRIPSVACTPLFLFTSLSLLPAFYSLHLPLRVQ